MKKLFVIATIAVISTCCILISATPAASQGKSLTPSNAPVLEFLGFGKTKEPGMNVPQVNGVYQIETDVFYYLTTKLTKQQPLRKVVKRASWTDFSGKWNPDFYREKETILKGNYLGVYTSSKVIIPTMEKELSKIEMWVEAMDGTKSNVITVGPFIHVSLPANYNDSNPFVGIWTGKWILRWVDEGGTAPWAKIPFTLIVKRINGDKAIAVYQWERNDRMKLEPGRVSIEGALSENSLLLRLTGADVTFTLDPSENKALKGKYKTDKGTLYADLSKN